MRNIIAIFIKQVNDTFKNKEVLIQFVMFPVIAIIMESAVKIEGMPENYFVNLFASMYIGMAPLVSMAAILSEEKEKNTLRALLLSNVRPLEYLIGTGSYILCVCMLGALVFGVTGNYTGSALVIFLLVMAVGILTSMLIGAAIGTWSRNQMMATSITVPVMMVFAFFPMLSMFNTSIEKVARITYSQQINILISQVEQMSVKFENVFVIMVNMTMAIALFIYGYRKTGLA